jgi:hypothetical protein
VASAMDLFQGGGIRGNRERLSSQNQLGGKSDSRVETEELRGDLQLSGRST